MFKNSKLSLSVATCLTLAGVTLAQNQLHTSYGDSASDGFGGSVAGAGDVNRDGYADIIVGAIGDDNDGVSTGSARVLSGRTGAVLYTFYGDTAGGAFGLSVAGAGDVDRDGHADLIVGAPQDDSNGTDSGTARVFSGKTGSILHTFYGSKAHGRFGSSVAGGGDVNEDGFADLIVGAPHDSSSDYLAGSAWVWSGKSGAVLYSLFGASGGDRFGGSVDGVGDVNRDGYDDFIVGAIGDDTKGSGSGGAKVYSGRSGKILYTFHGASPNEYFGDSVAGAGDVNRDGHVDFIIGARGGDENGFLSGRATVLSGADGSVLYTFQGDTSDTRLGWFVDGAGDVNRDGYPDLIVGVGGPLWSEAGTRIHSGADGSILYTIHGGSGSGSDYSVAGAGDVNGDGFADLVIGEPADDENGYQSGRARVFSGLGCCPPIGQSCTVAPCSTCPTMLATTSGGIPTPNNSSFALELINAPSNLAYAILAISGGSRQGVCKQVQAAAVSRSFPSLKDWPARTAGSNLDALSFRKVF